MASQRAADEDFHDVTYVNGGNGIELGDIRTGVYNTLDYTDSDPHTYSDITTAETKIISSTNNHARTVASNDAGTVTISGLIGKRAIYKAIVGLFLFCTLLSIFSGVIVYHVINDKLSDNERQVTPKTSIPNALAAVDRRLGVLDKVVQSVLANQISSGYFTEIGGWELIFRATAGNGDSVYEAWTTGKDTTDVKPSSMTRGDSRHYRNTKNITEWSSVRMVKYSLFRNSREVAYIIFNGTGSTDMNWFGLNRVLGSSWSAIASRTGTYNYFSIVGDVQFARRFFVNHDYGGCGVDRGYTVVSDTDSRNTCPFDTHSLYPQFPYSIFDGPIYWNKLLYRKADYMAIFFKHN